MMAEPGDTIDEFDPSNFILQERRNATVSVLQGLDADPEKAARALQLSRATGAPANVVHDNLENFEAQTKARIASELLRNNEYLRQFVNEQPLGAKIASDDFGNLDKVTQSVGKAWPGRYGGAGSLGAFIAGAFQGAKEGFGEGVPGTFSFVKKEEEKPLARVFALNPIIAQPVTAVELVLRSLGAAIHAATQGAGAAAEEFVLQATGDPNIARRAGREMSAFVEYKTTEAPKHRAWTPAEINELHQLQKIADEAMKAIEKAAPWLDRGQEPPLGIDSNIDKIKIEQSKVELDNLKEAEKDADKSLLKERSPEAFAQYVRNQTEAHIGVSPDAVRRLYGDKEPVWLDGILGFVPRLADQLKLAELSGDDIHIPVADWLAHTDPEVRKALQDDIRVRPGGVTKNEAVRVKESFEVFHGSGATFEAFDSQYMGSGEGAQAYAYGHYVAENRAVAQEYRRGVTISPEKTAHQYMLAAKGDRARAIEMIEDEKIIGATGKTSMGETLEVMNAAKRILESGRPTAIPEDAGSLYRVRIKREPEEFLDWDAKLSEQPEILRKLEESGTVLPFKAEWTGQQLHDEWVGYAKTTRELTQAKQITAQRLSEAGIPGVRFLDQGSRDKVKPTAEKQALLTEYQEVLKEQQDTLASYQEKAKKERPGWNEEFIKSTEGNIKRLEEGIKNLNDPQVTRNYVIFSDADLEILDRNGQAVRAVREQMGLRPLDRGQFAIDTEGMTHEGIGAGAELIYKPTEEYTAKETAVVEKVQEILSRIAPELQDVRTVQHTTMKGKEVHGLYVSPENALPIIAVSLESKNVGKTTRHEAIHFLRDYGFFTKEEWAAFEAEAKEKDWLKKHDVKRRYKKYENDPQALLEEAIADEFGEWGSATEPARQRYNSLVQQGFEKLAQFFKEILDGIKEIFGHTPTIDELFEKIESGEIGRRAMGEAAAPGEAKAAEGPKQGELDVTRMSDKKPFDRAAAIGMTEPQLSRYMKLIEQQKAEDREAATKKLVEAEKRKQTETWKQNEQAVRQEVVADFNTRPDVQVDEYFRTGKLYGEQGPKPKLAEDALTPEQRAALPASFVSKGGMDPSDVASLFGYGSKNEMIEALSTYTEARKQSGMQPMAFNRRLVDAEVERRMQERYGDLNENILEAVKDQVFSETQLDLLHEETVAAAMNANQAIPLPKNVIKDYIIDQINNSNLDTLKLRDYETAAGKAGREFEMALLKGDAMEAFRQKQRQYMAVIAAKEIRDLQKEVAQFERKAKQYRGREIPKSVDPEFGTYVQALLSEANVRVGQSPTEIGEGMKFYGYGSLDNFVTDKSSYGYELSVPEGYKAKPLEEMTVGEFREFKEAIDTLDKAGRDSQKIIVAGERMDREAFEKDVVAHLEKRPARNLGRDKMGVEDRKGNWIYGIDAPLTRIEELVKALDFREEMGPLFKALIIPYAQSKAKAFDMLADLSKKFDKLKGADREWQKTLSEELPGDFVYDGYYDVPLKLTRWNMIKMMLNMGTESNFGKLAYGFAAAEAGGKVGPHEVNMMRLRVERFVHQHATEADWRFVQQTFDLFEGWRKEADTLYRNLSGVAPKWIPARPIDTPFGQLAGGYFPLIPDRSRPLPGHRMIKEGGEGTSSPDGPLGGDYFKATTHTPFYKDRTGANYFVDITGGPEAIAGRMQQMIHDIAYRDFVVNAGKVIYNPKIMGAIRKHYGPEYARQFDPWLKRVANEFTASEQDLAEVNNVMSRMRFNLTASALPLNYTVMLSPSLGTFNPKAIYAYNSNRAANAKLVAEHSQELKHLIFSLDRDVGERFREVAGNTGWTSFQKQAVEKMFWGLLKAEQEMRSVTFYSKFMEAKEKGYTDFEAASLADSLVRERHGSMTPGDLPNLLAKKNEFVKWSTLFMGYFTTMRNWARQMPDQVRQGDMPGLAKTMWGVFGTAAIMNAAIFEKRKESDTLWSYLGRSIISTPLNMIPFARDVYSYYSEGHHPRNPIFSLGEAAYKVAKDGVDFWRGKKVKRPVRDVMSLAGAGIGVPGALQIGRTGGFLVDVARGEQRPRDQIEWARGLFTGEARLKK